VNLFFLSPKFCKFLFGAVKNPVSETKILEIHSKVKFSHFFERKSQEELFF